ncbi:YdcF family protein [Loigolactobacillus zhaoyuanensis]|uniref:YdcF family protein n=1 Tax=Loigolactobacillus zhaoyuanensis TaxID=2486017 RepID=A0ABW8UA61_9LACO|nr:YdcF family protein [Loigolactobacillus zhaoyuanensis]
MDPTFWLAGGLTLLLLLVFWVNYAHERRRLSNGIWLNVFVLVAVIWLLIAAFVSGQIWLLFPVLLLGASFFVAVVLGIYGLIIFLFYNARQVWRRESHSLANLLGLLLALALSSYVVWQALVLQGVIPSPLVLLLSFVPNLLVYVLLNVWNYLTISLVYQLNRPRYRQQAIVVLGAGLIDGERVSGLLAGRIKRAVAFYQQQQGKGGPAALLVFSGGQGADEKLPEAVAMQRYAVTELGVPLADTAVETRSVNTLENMRYSAQLIEQRYGSTYRAIFVSNGYHIFRAGLVARQAGFRANGIGARTAHYFLPTAFLREFVAIMVLHKRLHLAVAAILVLIAVLQAGVRLFS